MNNILKSFLVIVFSFTAPLLFAQEQVPMADVMRSDGKIYVVVAILLTVLVGLIVYVFLMDRKISSLEKRINKKG